MNIPIAIPAHVGDDGIWIQFVSPTTGKQAAINFDSLIVDTNDIVRATMREWAEAQIAMHRVHNPPEMPYEDEMFGPPGGAA